MLARFPYSGSSSRHDSTSSTNSGRNPVRQNYAVLFLTTTSRKVRPRRRANVLRNTTSPALRDFDANAFELLSRCEVQPSARLRLGAVRPRRDALFSVCEYDRVASQQIDGRLYAVTARRAFPASRTRNAASGSDLLGSSKKVRAPLAHARLHADFVVVPTPSASVVTASANVDRFRSSGSLAASR